MVVAQAAGLDVFGAVARWTDSAFSFGVIPNRSASSNSADDLDTVMQTVVQGGTAVVPPEYEELQAALGERGLPLYIPLIPDGFDMVDSELYINPNTQNVDFTLLYMKDADYISFNLIQNNGVSATIYEKDVNGVEAFEMDGVVCYIFYNEGATFAVWSAGRLEYSISTNSTTVDVHELIQTMI